MSFELITWDRFVTVNSDILGLDDKFEALCRQLFTNEFLSHNKITRYVHCNPNNPGIESDPVYDEQNHRWIGYQAKFFVDRPGYDQILHSAKETIKHYAGEVDCVYLYCNKPLSVKSKDYKEALDLLNKHHIALEPVTNEVILDQVRKYPYLAAYYFGNHSITHHWIARHNQYMLDTLGDRFNAEFNVDTDYSLHLSLFVHDESAVDYINKKKQQLITAIDSLGWQYGRYQSYLDAIKCTVSQIADIGHRNMEDSFQWADRIQAVVKDEIEKFKTQKIALQEQQKKLQSAFGDEATSKQEKETTRRQYYDIQGKIELIDILIDLPRNVFISDYEQQLILGKVLAVTGDAGIGKSQLFAHEVEKLLKGNRNVFLLLGGLFFSNDPLQEQIMKQCDLTFPFNKFIDIFEAIGEEQGRIIPLFIDALNETWITSLWQSFLPMAIDKVESCHYVKLAFSYRTEYESLLMNPSLRKRIENENICHITHLGFANNSLEATRQFFDHYGIPFTPLEYFEYEMTNPLFLTLYCRTYQGDEVDLPILYERLISNANTNLHKTMTSALKALGYEGNEDLLTPLISELSAWFADRGVRAISKADLMSLNYWNQYRLTAPVIIQRLIKEHILYSYVSEDVEVLYFSYDQMNDYFCAKAIVMKAATESDIRDRVVNDILHIENRQVLNWGNRDLFINMCALYADKFKRECIDMIDELDDIDKHDLFSRYLHSFQWRNKRTINLQGFMDSIDKYSAQPQDLWTVLIGNSVKTDHPLNADFLHATLLRYELNKRDYLWTIYINRVFIDDANRIKQLIELYDRGFSITMKSKKQTELLLTLFAWLLTSSDRTLRDRTSKAMIELLKTDYDLCEIMLKKFEKVNDPYVIQRLYGIVFGACCKRNNVQNDVYQSLSEYIYQTIFDQEIVYPDILLRDYARLIIERFLWEQPAYHGMISREKIIPPYKSDPIPDVPEDYTKAEYHGGLYRISSSMRFEHMGMYGDFGRYVLQSALHDFVIDHKKVFNYAMSFIINDLGYKEEWFGRFDRHGVGRHYYRYDTTKVERIGKKYQWITMHHILARISDNCEMRKPDWDESERMTFEGAWEPNVRDFDPTLNCHFMSCEYAPRFRQIDEFISSAQYENDQTILPDQDSQKHWLGSVSTFFQRLRDTMILTDENDTQWVLLTNYFNTGHDGLKRHGLYIWSWMYGFFVTPAQEQILAQYAASKVDMRTHELTLHNKTYTVFNREYPWSPSCRSLKEYAWINVSIPTGEQELVEETKAELELSSFFRLLKEQGYDEGDEAEDAYTKTPKITNEKVIVAREVIRDIGNILSTSSHMIWEEQYDASKPDTLSWNVPCAELIETLHLKQLKHDSFYYDNSGKLAAFDTCTTQQRGGVVVRKDLLDSFLQDRNMRLIWLLDAAKEIHSSDLTIAQWSEWTAILSYNKSHIQGDVYRVLPKDHI